MKFAQILISKVSAMTFLLLTYLLTLSIGNEIKGNVSLPWFAQHKNENLMTR